MDSPIGPSMSIPELPDSKPDVESHTKSAHSEFDALLKKTGWKDQLAEFKELDKMKKYYAGVASNRTMFPMLRILVPLQGD